MCLITFAWRAHPQHELVLAANRDEFHHRATAPAAWWADAPDVLGGRDLSQGGSWLALSRQRRMAAVTNVRRMVEPNPSAPSRGKLVADFVRSTQSAADFAAALRHPAEHYAGFNLLLYDGDALIYVSNQPAYTVTALTPGVHGISNAALDTPWPKLCRLTTAMHDWVDAGNLPPDHLFSSLSDRRPAADADLPDTGVGLEMERFLSSPFIVSPSYGTRCSTVLSFSSRGPDYYAERRFDPSGALTGETIEALGR